MFQQINIGAINQMIGQEFMHICKQHASCVGCPLKTQDMEIQGGVIRCETGRAKEKNKC